MKKEGDRKNNKTLALLLGAIGWYGTVAIIAAYALIGFKLIGADSFVYQFLNLTGAAGIVGVALHQKAYQPAVLNIVWTVITGCVTRHGLALKICLNSSISSRA